MTVRRIPPSVGDSYEGLSTDDKPTGVVINSTFREQDTQAVWITYNGTDWVLKGPIGEVKASPTANTLLARLKDIVTALEMTTEASVDTGIATDGSQTTIEDTSKNWEVNCWKNALIEVVIDDVHYVRFASSNTADTITIAALPEGIAVGAGDTYACKIPIHVTDIERWGGTALTGRDISVDLANLDIALSVLRDALQGASSKDLTTVEAAIVAVGAATLALRTASTLDSLELAIVAVESAVLALRTTSTLDTVEAEVTAVETAVLALRTTSTLDTLQAAMEALRTTGTLDTIQAAIEVLRTTSTLDTIEEDIVALLTGTILAVGSNLIGKVGEPAVVETPFTGTGDLVVGTHKIAPGAKFKLKEISLHLGAAPTTTTQTLVIALDSAQGAAYDQVLFSKDLVAYAVTDLTFIPDAHFQSGDVVTCAWTNTNGVTFGLVFKHQVE